MAINVGFSGQWWAAIATCLLHKKSEELYAFAVTVITLVQRSKDNVFYEINYSS